MKQQVWQCACGSADYHGLGRCRTCYTQHRAREKAYGRWEPDRIDPSRAREHLARLRAAGLRAHHIAQLGNVHDPAILRVEAQDHISRSTEAAILAVPIPERPADVLPDTARVRILGAQRRIQSLIAHGYSQTYLAQRLDINDPSGMRTLVGRSPSARATGETVTVARDRHVRELFAELQFTPGPSTRARRMGEKNKWPLPLEWDEDEIDDPDARPIRARRSARSDRAAQRDERRERVLELAGRRTDAEIAEEIGLSARSVERLKARYLPNTDEAEVGQDEQDGAPLADEDTEDEVMELTEDEW